MLKLEIAQNRLARVMTEMRKKIFDENCPEMFQATLEELRNDYYGKTKTLENHQKLKNRGYHDQIAKKN